jgi:Kef-type K+ transport system membrane component KefB
MIYAMVGFGTLLVFVLAGLLGPLLALPLRWFTPVLGGEILGGVLAGPHVLGAIDPAQSTVSLLSEVGFAMLMLTAGMHLPLRDRRLGGSVRTGAVLALSVAALAVPAGLLASHVAGGSHAALYAVVLASGSSAVLLPSFREAGVGGSVALRVMAQTTIADIFTIVSVPIVLQPSRVGDAVLGTFLVALTAAALVVVGRAIAPGGFVRLARARSKQRRWALDLRVALLVLFLLAWIAVESGTSILIAGFGAGVTIAILGGPKRLSTQVRGIADGFFIPVYFVVLGARLDVGGLFASGSLLALAATLTALNVAIRLLVAAVVRMPVGGALAATAQLGVPAAVASLGLADHVLSPVTATAIVISALASLAISTVGVDLLVREAKQASVPARAPESPRPA